MTSKDTLLILASRAPQEPDAIAMREWEDQFHADYPVPTEFWPSTNRELSDAEEAVAKARSKADGHSWVTHFAYGKRLTHQLASPGSHWYKWKEDRRSAFARDEWPLIWARRIAALIE